MQGLAFALAYDQASGFDTSQQEATDGIDRLIDRLEAGRRERPQRRSVTPGGADSS